MQNFRLCEKILNVADKASVRSEFFKLTEYMLLPLKLTFFSEFPEKSDPIKFDSSKLVSYRIEVPRYVYCIFVWAKFAPLRFVLLKIFLVKSCPQKFA